jgi:glycogen(starch) synthase
VTANSASTLEHVRRLVPGIGRRSSCIYYGIPPPAEPPKPLKLHPPRLLCLGRLAPEKGFDVAITALPRVLRRFPDARLRIAGDGELRAALERLARERGVADAVRFSGWTDPAAVPALINEASIVWMPSRWEEAFGLVAAETALMARPIVATRVGGLPEVVLDGATGLLVDADAPDALARATLALLDQPERATRLGQAARARAARLFSLERYAEQYQALYERCIAGSAARGPS